MYSLIAPDDGAPASEATFETLRVRAAYGEAGNRPNYGQKFTALNATNNIDGNAGLVLGVQRRRPEHRARAPARDRDRHRRRDARTSASSPSSRCYQRNISNLLLQRALPTSTGLHEPVLQRRRDAQPRRRGGAAGASGRQGTVEWTTRAILTLNRSKVTDLPDGIDAFDITAVGFGAGLGAFRIEEGKSATQIVATIDGDGDVDVVGNGEPDFRVGWSNERQGRPTSRSARCSTGSRARTSST